MVLIDAYNVLHITGVLPPHLAGVGVHGLARLVARSRYARRGRGAVWLICDGKRRLDEDESPYNEAGDGNVRIVFCGPGESADDRIEEMLESARRAGGVRESMVVSSDRRLIAAAKRVRAESVTGERFLQHLAADVAQAERLARAAGGSGGAGEGRVPVVDLRGTVPLSGPEVALWAAAFGVAGEVQAEPAAPRTHSAELNAEPASPRPAKARRPDRSDAKAQTGRPALPSGLEEGVSHAAWLGEALRMWPDALSVDDLDMQKWLDQQAQPPSRDSRRRRSPRQR